MTQNLNGTLKMLDKMTVRGECGSTHQYEVGGRKFLITGHAGPTPALGYCCTLGYDDRRFGGEFSSAERCAAHIDSVLEAEAN